MPLPEPRTRRLWMRVRSKDWWDNVVLHHFTDEEWKENFRMTRQSFMTLCSMVEGYTAPGEATIWTSLSIKVEETVELMDLGFLALSDVSPSTAQMNWVTLKVMVGPYYLGALCILTSPTTLGHM
ncbi:hypothetical protein PGIGA_G00147060 [Pangasianodon gigas]|uniref:Uncharacterized protein n=1 Tax=Pangasianodon gigas TaxID=30993 RepID=A0ACC5XMZ2_PANGG|nr:hypothetical protein [Pangasianodon gigas]